MSTVGLIAMSAKPYHSGHDGLIRRACEQVDQLLLFVSLSDRRRPGELPVLGRDMDLVWRRWIEPGLPARVQIDYGTASPIGRVLSRLGEERDSDNISDSFIFFSDPDDLLKLRPTFLRYFPELLESGQLKLQPVSRASTVDISGTQVRRFIQDSDLGAFIRSMPRQLQAHAQEIFSLLQRSAREDQSQGKSSKVSLTETLLRILGR